MPMTTHELAKRLKSKGMAPPKRKPIVVGDKSMAKAIKEAEEKQSSGSLFKFQVPGDTLAGRLISVPHERDGKYGAYWEAAIETKEGPRSFKCNDSLKRELEPMKKGDRIAIVFREQVKTGRGRPFKVFAVAKA